MKIKTLPLRCAFVYLLVSVDERKLTNNTGDSNGIEPRKATKKKKDKTLIVHSGLHKTLTEGIK